MSQRTLLLAILAALQADHARLGKNIEALARVIESTPGKPDGEPPHLVTIRRIIAEAKDVTPDLIKSNFRYQPLPEARQIGAYVAGALLPNADRADVARVFGLSRSGLRYSLNAVKDRLSIDPTYAAEVRQIIESCRITITK